MLVKFGPAIADARGKIGGLVFSKNRYGSYARTWKKPVNPNSAAQQKVRADMGALVSAWSIDLTQLQRDAWAVYAAAITFVNSLGETITLTGYNQYIRSNIARLNNGMTRISDGPVVLLLPPTDSDFDVSLSEASQQITVTFDDTADWCTENSARMAIHQGIPQNSARQFFGGRVRRCGEILGNSGSPPSSPQTVDVTFPIAADQKDWITGKVLRSDGRLSPNFRDDAIVSA